MSEAEKEKTFLKQQLDKLTPEQQKEFLARRKARQEAREKGQKFD